MVDRKDQLEELNLYLDNAVSQLERCARAGREGSAPVIDDYVKRIDGLLGDAILMRNDIRDAFMKELASRPKKLPTL